MPEDAHLGLAQQAVRGGAVAASSTAPADGSDVRPAGARAFDFLVGSWRVAHRRLKRRLAGCSEWATFGGTVTAWPLMGGLGIVDDNLLEDPSGAYRAVSFRVYDPSADLWSIRWVDARSMRLEPPVVGRFEEGVGTFLGDDELDGRPIRVRFVWSGVTERSARWEQAFSPDAGRTWETNWVMSLERSA